MKQLNCLIIDDEPLAKDIIKTYIAKIPFLNLQSTFDNAWTLQSYLMKHDVDLIFLDIEMPGLDGLTFLKSIKNPPNVIFITAYRDYAIEAFDVEAIDYLLKPVSFERFLKAVNKVSLGIPTKAYVGDELKHIYVLVDRQMKKIMFAEILYLEAQGDYVKVYQTNQKPLLTKKTLREFAEELHGKGFLQIHRSFIINKEHVNAYTHDKVQINDEWLKISRSFKDQVNL